MPRPLSPFRTAIFLGQSDDAGVEVAPDQALVIRNMYRDRGKLVARLGSRPHTEGDLAGTSDEIDGIFSCRIRTTDLLFAVYGGHVYDCFPLAPPVILTNGSSRFTANRPVTFAWIDQKVYVGDGVNPLIRCDATSASVVMVSAPGAGMTAVAVAGGSLSTGLTYTYRVVFLSADGNESAASDVVTATVTSAGVQQIQLSAIPVAAAGSDVTGRRLYRISGSGTTHKLLTTIADNITTSYLDNTSDSNLGDTLVNQDRSAPPPCAILCEHEGRLLMANSDDAEFDRQTLYISNYREPWWFPAAPDLEDPNQGTRIALQGPAAGEITGIASHGDRAYVFTWDSCYMLIGDQPLDFSLKEFAEIGCVAHRSIVSAKGRLLWLAADGVYEARAGSEVRRVSKPIDTFLKSRTAEQMVAAHAFLFDDRYYLCFPDTVRYLDLEYSDLPYLQWGELTWTVNCSTVARASATRLPRIFAGATGEGRPWEMEVDEDDDGEPISCYYESPQWDLGNPGREKRIHYVGATFTVGEGSVSVTLAKGTGPVIETYAVDLTTPTEEGGEIVRLFQRAIEEARAEYFQMAFSHEKTAPFQTLALDGNWSLAT